MGNIGEREKNSDFNFDDESFDASLENRENYLFDKLDGIDNENTEEITNETEVSDEVEGFGDFETIEGLDDLENEMEKSDSIDTTDYQVLNDDNGFISDTGDIVVMNDNGPGDGFKLIYADIEKIAIVHRIRKGTNVDALLRSIKSTGLLQPLTVAPTATEGCYVLLDGYRRILACAKAGKRRIPCIVNTKVSTPEIPVLEALYNHNKSYNIKEIIDYINYLEKEKGIMSASMIEYLLQMNSGDYTKLKDIIEDDDEDITSKLYNGIYTIDQAFKKLEQRRKKESAEEKEQKKAEKVYADEAESGVEALQGSGEETDDGPGLTDEEIKSLAISPESLDEDLEDESLEDMVKEGNEIEGFEPHKQDPNDRERLDPTLRKSVLARDKNTCQICKVISGQEYTEVLDVHHIQEVYLGGSDDIDNLISACVVCHKLVHLYGRGELYIRPLEEMDKEEQEKFKRIVKLGNIIRKGMALKGIKKEQLKKMDKADTIGRRLKGSSDQVAG